MHESPRSMIPIGALLFFLSVSNGLPGRQTAVSGHGSRIVGGQPVPDIRSRPFHAAIEMLYVDLQICSGAIISPNWVVTSGHCVALLIPEDIQVRVGTVRNAFGGDVYEVSQIEQHPDFSQVWWTSVDYDVGVIKTATSIVFSLEVRPIGLPLPDTELPVGTPATVSGWGTTSGSEDSPKPRALQIGTVQIESRPACNLTQAYIGNITSRMICAGNVGADVCFGDNGGPLVVGNTTYGMVSWGIGCGLMQFLSVFTNLGNSEIRNFITDITGL